MAAISQPTRRTLLLPSLRALFTIQKFNQTLAGGGIQLESTTGMAADSNFQPGQIEFSKWRKLDSRDFGITGSMIPSPSWIVLKTLKQKGFEAYLVGGCVRDLILNRIPKDFDVITTAGLSQIKKQFRRAVIVGRRFPICRVHIRGSVIEVSSFDTVANKGDERKNFFVPKMPKGCNENDVIRWRNSLQRDFTINSLFYDPFVNRIYDYANAMADLKSLKLRTLIPAQLSFEEDCARILRGLRLAARLNFSFSMETETAMRKLSPSIMSLGKSRLMMEVNYMLSYGAAVPSLCLLQRYNLLEVLLPFHAAYLTQQAIKQSSDTTSMLMRLFSSLDQLVSCERPAHDSLWVALLAFHLTLVNNPQHMLMVLTFASVLYHGNWKQGVDFARQHAKAATLYVPEISDSDGSISDDELAEGVENMAVQVKTSGYMLTDADNLQEMTSKFSGLVFVSKNMAKNVVAIFDILANDVTSVNIKRERLKIDYASLGQGIARETRFVLGKIILDTLGLGVISAQGAGKKRNSDYHEIDGLQKFDMVKENSHSQMEMKQKDDKMCNISPVGGEFEPARAKKQKSAQTSCSLPAEGAVTKKQKAVVDKQSGEKAMKDQDLTEDKDLVHQKASIKNNTVKKQTKDMKQKAVVDKQLGEKAMKEQDLTEDKGLVHQKASIKNNTVKKQTKDEKRRALVDVKHQQGCYAVIDEDQDSEKHQQTAVNHSKRLQKMQENTTKHKKSVDESEFAQRESTEEVVRRKQNLPREILGSDDKVEQKKSKKTLFDLFK